MAGISLLTHTGSELEAARRQIRDAVIDFSIPDDNVLELRADARRIFEEVKELERKSAKKGLFGFLGF
jgi:hypothetical protein